MSTQASVILATTNGGATWSAQSSGAHADTQLYGVAFADASHGWAVGDDTSTGASVILATRNGGATWSAQGSGVVADTGLRAVACANPSDAWAVGDDTSTGAGTILATTDAGYPAATLTGFTPTSGKRGAVVTVTGTSFGARRGTSCVRFGATKCHKYLSWSNTRIRCRVPAKARFGTLKLTVKTAAGLSNAKHFKVKR